MQFVQEKGLKIPQDISLAGFDDTPICQQIVPTLTSVRQDAVSRASHALAALKSLIQREPVASPIILPVQLIPRNSTAPLNQLEVYQNFIKGYAFNLLCFINFYLKILVYFKKE